MDSIIPWVILVGLVTYAFIAFTRKVDEEHERRKADSEANWSKLVSENMESNWWEIH